MVSPVELQATELHAPTPTQETVPSKEQILRFVNTDVLTGGTYRDFLERNPDGVITLNIIEGDIREKILANQTALENHMRFDGTPAQLSWMIAVRDPEAPNEISVPSHPIDERFPLVKDPNWRSTLGKHKIQVHVKVWWQNTGPNFVVDASIHPLRYTTFFDNQPVWEQPASPYHQQYTFDVTDNKLIRISPTPKQGKTLVKQQG